MKITKSTIDGRASSMVGHVGAGGVTVVDTGGFFTGVTLEEILAEIGAGSSPGSFLTVVGGGKGTVQAHGNFGSTEVIDVSLANYHWGTMDASCTFTTTGWTNLKDCAISVEMIQDGTGGRTPTFTGVTWIGGTPTWVTTAGTVAHVVLFSRDGGTTIYGVVIGTGVAGFATPAIVLGTAAAAGAATTTIRSDATLLAFDATVPAAIGTAAAGSATVAARRDHVHNLSAETLQAIGSWEVVMTDGVSSPPDPLTNEDETDWLYGLVT